MDESYFFRPFGAWRVGLVYPRHASWALFFCRFAAAEPVWMRLQDSTFSLLKAGRGPECPRHTVHACQVSS